MLPPIKNLDTGLGKNRNGDLYQNDIDSRHNFSISTLPVTMPMSGKTGCSASVEGKDNNTVVRNESIFASNGMSVSSLPLVFLLPMLDDVNDFNLIIPRLINPTYNYLN